jgi:hypothetical protein
MESPQSPTRSTGLATVLPVLTRGAGSLVQHGGRSDGARTAVESESAVEAHQDPHDRVDMLPAVEFADIRSISPCLLIQSGIRTSRRITNYHHTILPRK